MKDSKEAAQAMSDFVNNMTCDIDGFVKGMIAEHRTLQQTFTNLCFAWIRKSAERYEQGNYDGRNEYSCKKCAEIVEKIELFDGPFI